MKLTIIGTGYVGLVTGACFAEMGNIVYCVDIDNEKIQSLRQSKIPIYEPGLEDLVHRNIAKNNLFFTNDLKEGLDNSEVSFIAVGTPMDEDGRGNIQHVLSAAKEIGKLVSHDMIIVNKSTVPIGTAKKVEDIILEELENRGVNFKIRVISNPEFLKEGSAVEDFMGPDRVIIGSQDEEAIEILKELYTPFTIKHERFLTMDTTSAEMTKYAANAMLATRISFVNEIANICEKIGADINSVREGMGSDPRIGFNFLYPGCGYGGSCLPKDVKALIRIAEDQDYDLKILKAVEAVNEDQKLLLVKKIIQRFGKDMERLKFAIWGLSFKPNTDDIREAPSLVIINELTKLGAKIQAYDPVAKEVAQDHFKNNSGIRFEDDKYKVLENVDGIILLTEWKEFRSPDFEEMSNIMRKKVIFDGRNQYNKEILKKMGFEYYFIGN
jgi:UDPglucose 6-dehydrogenase